ncbi:MAG TPA: SIR2 family protein, partial [Caulobacteraceae bacterium]|nr:SIR2 family protein [Caulobacteraceae bacterium]
MAGGQSNGGGDDVAGRILTAAEYDAAYAADRTQRELLSEIVGPRSLLFIGCSLVQDRTLGALRELKQRRQMRSPPHYAFLPFPEEDARAARRQFLAEAGVHPI